MTKPIFLSVLAALAIAGCGAAARATTPAPAAAPAALSVDGDRHMLRGVPDVMQRNNYTCGVASAQCVLQYYGIWAYQDGLARSMSTTEAQGTHPAHITSYLNKQGLNAKIVENLTPSRIIFRTSAMTFINNN